LSAAVVDEEIDFSVTRQNVFNSVSEFEKEQGDKSTNKIHIERILILIYLVFQLLLFSL